MDDSHIQEASMAADMVAGLSSYFHGVGYSLDKFKEELSGMVQHIKSQQ